MRTNKAMTKGQYIKWNKKIVILAAIMLVVMTGCSKKQGQEVTAEPTPVITQSPEQEAGQQEEQETADEDLVPEEEKESVTEEPSMEEPALDSEEGKEEVTVTPNPTKEEEFTEEDPIETITPEGDILTKEQAIVAVAAFSKEALGLENELGQYSIIVDGWTTIVHGKECYCLNVYDYMNDRQQLVKMLYVTMDGKEVYVHDDDLGEFKRITE